MQPFEDPLLRVKAAVEKQIEPPSPDDVNNAVARSMDPDTQRIFPGLDGIPFRRKAGQVVPSLKTDDPDFMQPKMIADAHVQVFNMNKPEDVRAYAEVWDKAAKGLVLISKEDSHWSDKEQTFIFFLRWGELYLELSKEGADAHRSFK